MSTDLNTYLTFKVKEHLFGVGVEKVLEISEFIQPKPVPDSPSYMIGVIEFRNQVIPLIDCGVKFNMKPIEIDSLTCFVVLELHNNDLGKKFKIGIVVDAVSDVFEASDDQLLAMEDDYRPDYIFKSFKTESGLVLILNADKIFSEKDIISIDDVVSNIM